MTDSAVLAGLRTSILQGTKRSLKVDAFVSAAFIAVGILAHFFHIPGISGHEGYLIGVGAGLGVWTLLRGMAFRTVSTLGDSSLATRIAKSQGTHAIIAAITTAILAALGLSLYFTHMHLAGEILLGASFAALVYTGFRGYDYHKNREATRTAFRLPDSSVADSSSRSVTPPASSGSDQSRPSSPSSGYIVIPTPSAHEDTSDDSIDPLASDPLAGPYYQSDDDDDDERIDLGPNGSKEA